MFVLYDVLILLISFIVVTKGADFLIDGSIGIASYYCISPLIISLTLVALGTSAPEIFVTISSMAKDNTNIAIGNIIGSNISNIGLVLGLCGAINPIILNKLIANKFSYYLLIYTLVSVLLLFLPSFNWISGTILTSFLVFNFWTSSLSYKKNIFLDIKKEKKYSKYFLAYAVFNTLIGIFLLHISSDYIVLSASNIALTFNISPLTIGLTIVALGTSLPELVTAFVASYKKQNDILLGSIVGSNIANITLVLPIVAFLNKSPITFDININALISLFFTVILFLACFFSRIKIPKKVGYLFLIMYFMYLSYLLY